MLTRLRYFESILMAIALAHSAPLAAAEYPIRPVAFVVPYAPGGATDQLARTLGQYLEAKLRKPFVIENRVGASSAVGATFVSNAAPDGYTILMATSTTMAINPSVFRRLAYQPLVDLTPVALIANSPFVLVVNNDLPVHSVADLVRLARSKPGELTFASSGTGSAHHLDMQLFSSMTGIQLVHVVYKGTLPALNDIVGGHVKLMFSDMSAALPLIQAGKVRALGGVSGYDAAAWQMVVLPTKTPDEIIDILHTSLREFQATATFKETVLKRGLDPLVTPSREELRKFVEHEISRWRSVVEEAGVAGVP